MASAPESAGATIHVGESSAGEDQVRDTSDMTFARRLVWPLTNRGFFSEYNLLLWVLLHSRREGSGFVLEVHPDSVISPDLARRLFKVDVQECERPVVLPHLPQTALGLIRHQLIYLRHHRVLKSPVILFRLLWRQRFEQRLSESIDLVSTLHELHKEVWRGEADVTDRAEDAKPVEQLVTNDYLALHIRRGDKLVTEAQRFPLAEYIALIPERFLDLPILVCTDDYSAFEELQDYAETIGYRGLLSTTADLSHKGYDWDTFRRRPVEHRDSEIQRLLFDFTLMCKSTYFVGSFSSNLSRAVYIARGGRNSCSVDTEFAVVQ
jgi:hypothetical protein